MVCRIKDVAGQVWDDCVTCARLFTSFCGVLVCGIALINSVHRRALRDISFKPVSNGVIGSSSSS